MQPIKKQQQQNETKKRFGLVEYQLSFLCTSLNNQRATILDRIELNSKPPPPTRLAPPQIKDEAARRAKTCHFSVFQTGGAGSRFFINLVQDCRFRLHLFLTLQNAPLVFAETGLLFGKCTCLLSAKRGLWIVSKTIQFWKSNVQQSRVIWFQSNLLMITYT